MKRQYFLPVIVLCMVVNAVASPSVVSLYSPANNATKQPVNPSFSWSSSTPAGATTISSYKVQFSTQGSSSSYFGFPDKEVWFTPATTSTSSITLLSGTQYYWRVVTTASDVTTSESSIWAIKTVATVLGAPVYPVSLSVNTSTATIQWDPTTGASSYSYQYGTTNPPTASSSTTLTSIGLSGLSSNTAYYWRVQAINIDGVGGTFCSVQSFTTGQLPGTVTGLSSTTTPTTATISWSVPTTGTRPFTYSYKYGLPSGVQLGTTGTTTSTSATISGLYPSTTYAWEVTASNTYGGNGTWTSQQFTTSVGTPSRSKLLSIPNRQQLGLNWCWNACCEMTLRYYKVTTPVQQSIANYACLGLDAWNYLTLDPESGGVTPCDKILCHYQPGLTNKTKYLAGNLSSSDIDVAIDAETPVFAGWKRVSGTGIGHMVLITGYIDMNGMAAAEVIYNDPHDIDDAPARKLPFLVFVQGNTYKWDGSLRMTVSPSGVIPTGISDRVQVGGPARTINLGDTAIYTAKFIDCDYSGTVAKSWNWSLVLLHDRGEYLIVPLVNGKTSSDPLYCNWKISIGVLPDVYNWKRNTKGQILGQVVVGCVDSDSPDFYHSAAVDATFNDDSTKTGSPKNASSNSGEQK